MGDFGSLLQSEFLTLLRRMGGSGYSNEDDANRVKELNAIAKIAAMVSETLESSARNMFVTKAVERLSDYERLFWMPSNERLTNAQRQARFTAFMRALPKMIEARLDKAFDSYLGTTNGETVRPTSDTSWTGNRASGFGGLYVQRYEPSADSQELRTLDAILSRGLPARAMGGQASVDFAQWVAMGGGLSHVPDCDRKHIHDSGYGVPLQTKSMAAVFEYYPGSIVGVEKWREIQAMLLWKSRGFEVINTNTPPVLSRTIVVMGSLTAGSTAVLDGPSTGASSIAWGDRLVQAWGVFSATDIRLTGSPDLTARPATDHAWLGTAKLGDGATPYVHELVDVASGANVNAQLSINGSEDLTLKNNAGGTRYFVLMIRCSPRHVVGTTADTQPIMNYNDIPRTHLAQLYESTVVRGGDAAGAGGYTKTTLFSGDRGAIRRICYTGGLKKAVATGNVNRVILDSSEDWRKRFVLVIPMTVSDSGAYRTVNVDGADARSGITDAVGRLFYTGPGAATGAATQQAYQHPDAIVGSKQMWMFADSTTGDLVAEMKSTDSNASFASGLFMLIGSEQQDGGGVISPIPFDATDLVPLDLNQPQNNGCFAQGFQGGVPRANLLADPPRSAVTAPPLGLISDGASLPRRPVAFRVRERIGDPSDSTYECRQKLFGQRKRLISVAIPASTTIDADVFNDPTAIQSDGVDQMDFRDRFIWIEGRYLTTDITVSNAAPVSDVTANRFSASMYSGPFGDKVVTINATLRITAEFSRKVGGYHSRLRLQNLSGAAIYVNMAVECSGYLGLTDRRLYGASP